MENSWKEFLIEDLCSIRRGASPRPIKDFIKPDGVIPWVKISDATASDSRYITRTGEKIIELGRNKSVEVTKGDLILSNSATPGLPKIMKIDACIHDGWLLLREFKGILKEYMYYLLINERERIVGYANGTVFQNLKTDILRKFKVKVPGIEEQRKIVSILSSLDDKIELNNEVNKTLEEIAQAVFKSWFVDFKPFKDGEFEESELGSIPKGWKTLELSKLGNIITGKTPSKNNPEHFGNEYKFITPKDINGDIFITKSERGLSNEGYEKMRKNMHYKYSIGVSCIGSDLGEVYLNNDDGFTNQQINTLTLNNYKYYPYVYICLKNMKDDFKNMASGSAVPIINKTAFSKIKIVVSSEKYIEDFYNKVDSIFRKMLININQNEELKETRDTLLPKLISGKIRLND